MVLLSARILLGCIKPITQKAGHQFSARSTLCSRSKPFIFILQVHVIGARLAKPKWSPCALGLVTPITWKGREEVFCISSLGSIGQQRLQAASSSYASSKMSVRRGGSPLDFTFIWTRWWFCGLLSSLKDRVWRNMLSAHLEWKVL